MMPDIANARSVHVKARVFPSSIRVMIPRVFHNAALLGRQAVWHVSNNAWTVHTRCCPLYAVHVRLDDPFFGRSCRMSGGDVVWY